MNIERISKKVISKTLSIYDLEGSFDDALEIIQGLKLMYENDKTARIEVAENGYNGYLNVVTERPETDAEYNQRKAVYNQSKEYRRARYETLKREFGE